MPDSSRAVSSLCEIMGNVGLSVRNRITAAETLLNYETTEAVTERVKTFLAQVFESKAADVSDRLEALRLTRRAEARKVTQGNVRPAEVDASRELWRDMELAARRVRLIKAGLWKTAVERGDWGNDLMSPDYQPPNDGRSFSDLFED